MKKLILISILSLFALQPVSAQRTGAITGKMVDSATGEIVVGPTVELMPMTGDTTRKKYELVDYEGKINMRGLAYGEYRFTASFLGYEPHVRQIELNERTLNLGDILMKQSSINIDAIRIEAIAIRTSLKGDTIIYNASAFKVSDDADADKLLAKMPGLKVEDGKVEAQGEEVKKILVDGKETFDDIQSALKTIPASVIKKVEVFNKLSDQAEMTGLDDGEGYKALNFVTDIERGSYGKFYGGYGNPDLYNAGGNVNFTKGERRLMLQLSSNNMNRRDFSSGDILGVMGGNSRGFSNMNTGLNRYHSFGLSYNNSWNDKWKLNLSYRLDYSKNTRTNSYEREYISEDESYDFQTSVSNSETKNISNRLVTRVDYQINSKHKLMLRSSLSFQDNNSLSSSDRLLYLAAPELAPALKSKTANHNDAENTGYDISNKLTYFGVLGSSGRSISSELEAKFSDNQRDSYIDNITTFYGGAGMDSDNRRKRENPSGSYNLNGNVIYTEPLSKTSRLTMQYRVQYNYSDTDRRDYLWDPVLQAYSPDYDTDQSNINNSGYLRQNIGPGFNWSKNRNTFNANVTYQHSSLSKTQELPASDTKKASFSDVVYNANLRRYFNPTNSLSIRARSSTRNPSIDQLHRVADYSDSQNIQLGNPDLSPSYNHNLSADYTRSNINKGTTFSVRANYGITSNSIVTSLLRESDGSETTQPVNMNGEWNVGGSLGYGFPIIPIRCNLNLDAGVSYSETPAMFNGAEDVQSQTGFNYGASLGSNISEKIDFSVRYSGRYNIASNAINEQRDNRYMINTISANFKLVTWLNFTFSGNVSYSKYSDLSDQDSDFGNENLMCNLSVGKKLFKNNRGEIAIGVNDLFNQKEDFTRTVTPQYIQVSRNNTLGRFYSIMFVYNLRSYVSKDGNNTGRFGGDGTAPPRFDHGGGRPGGMGGMGGGRGHGGGDFGGPF